MKKACGYGAHRFAKQRENACHAHEMANKRPTFWPDLTGEQVSSRRIGPLDLQNVGRAKTPIRELVVELNICLGPVGQLM